ncbi:MAG: HEAT repeat domain-containing protein [Coriobacteriia bacterium]
MSTAQDYPRAEEALRLLAAACGAARIYPAASALPAEAIAALTARANQVVGAQGPLRFSVNAEGFAIGDDPIAMGSSQVAALARALHALQVGQLLIAPGLTEPEAAAFVAVANASPALVRTKGGARSLLAASQVAHIAVVEVSLRASEEEGLLGIDLMTAPLDDIAPELEKSAERWARASGPGDDDVAAAIAEMEAATRQVAIERVSAALMRLDEPTRMRVLGLSLKADSNGQRMEGMLGVIAQMKPAALARLLTLVAAQVGTDSRRIATALELPPETARLLAEMLAPDPGGEQERPTELPPESPPAAELARYMAEPDDLTDINRQVAIASPSLSASRALATAVALSRKNPDADTVLTIGDSLPQAVCDGAFATVREALRRLDELSTQVALLDAISSAKATLSQRHVLNDMCSVIASEGDAAIAGEILATAGPLGAEVLLDAYVSGPDTTRDLLRPVLRAMSEPLLGVARARLRAEEPTRAIAIVRTLAMLGDRRVVPVMGQALNHLDEGVRFAAISALADIPEPEAANALVRALGHSEPQTQRFAVREIGRVKAAPAIHQLTRALEDLNVIQRTHETKKEVIRALERIGTPEAEHALHRTADRPLAWGRKSRELREQARAALEHIRATERPKGAETP